MRATSPARAGRWCARASAPTSSTTRTATSCRSLWGGEHTFKMGGGISYNQMPPRTTVDSGTFQFRGDAPYNPANPTTYPFQFDVIVGPEDVEGYDVFSKDRRYYFFLEDKYRVSNNLTLNLGLRYDNQRQTPDSSTAFAPRAGFAWDVTGSRHDRRARRRRQVLRLSAGGARPDAAAEQRADAVPDHLDHERQRSGRRHSPAGRHHRFGRQSRRRAFERGGPGAAESAARPDHRRGEPSTGIRGWTATHRKLPYTVSWSLGLTHQIRGNSAVSVDYVANASRDQLGVIDINEPVNRVRPGVNVFDPTGRADPGRGAQHAVRARPPGADQPGVRRRLQVDAGLVQQADVQSLERPRRLHAAVEPLRRPRQSRRAARLARQRAGAPTTAASRPTGRTCWRRPARGTRGRR